jgi:hypothetical protein
MEAGSVQDGWKRQQKAYDGKQVGNVSVDEDSLRLLRLLPRQIRRKGAVRAGGEDEDVELVGIAFRGVDVLILRVDLDDL